MKNSTYNASSYRLPFFISFISGESMKDFGNGSHFFGEFTLLVNLLSKLFAMGVFCYIFYLFLKFLYLNKEQLVNHHTSFLNKQAFFVEKMFNISKIILVVCVFMGIICTLFLWTAYSIPDSFETLCNKALQSEKGFKNFDYLMDFRLFKARVEYFQRAFCTVTALILGYYRAVSLIKAFS